MNYCNGARNRVFDPLDVRLRPWKQNPFHSTSKDSLETCHPPSIFFSLRNNEQHTDFTRIAPHAPPPHAHSPISAPAPARARQRASILRNIVISHDVGCYAKHYESLRSARPHAKMQLVLHLCNSQAHAARNFRERIQYLVAKLFNQSTDEAVNYVKQTVFGISNYHPVVIVMLATHEGAQISLLLLDGTY